ncbi:hypothetical protein PQR67_05985 [Paraburkholderia fungorum]|uniref:hypothetical protein n=1 Tax=Paraburkholderia fungorum TaxID=134537 RepID=UPI0038B87DAD
MSYSSVSAILAFQDSKEAALYSDRIVPIELADLIPLRGSGDLELFEILPKILPGSLVDTSAPRSVHPEILSYVAKYLIAFPDALGIHTLASGESLEDRARSQIANLQKSMAALLNSVSEPIAGVHGVDLTASADSKTDDVSCQLIGLHLVDISGVSWRHLIEFREDAASLQALRNLRLFMQEKFDGKSKDFIRDSLLLAIDKHDTAVKKWGFETKQAVLESIFSSKSLQALGAGTITIALGAPIALGAAVAAAFEIGSFSLKIATKRRGLAEFRRFDPVTYLVSARGLSEA